jgi:hypothetical protein
MDSTQLGHTLWGSTIAGINTSKEKYNWPSGHIDLIMRDALLVKAYDMIAKQQSQIEMLLRETDKLKATIFAQGKELIHAELVEPTVVAYLHEDFTY